MEDPIGLTVGLDTKILYFIANKISAMYTHDQDLLTVRKVSWKRFHLIFEDPLAER